MICGNCGASHASAAEVKACHQRPEKKKSSLVAATPTCNKCGGRVRKSQDGEWEPLCPDCYHLARTRWLPEPSGARHDVPSFEETQEWLAEHRSGGCEGVPEGLAAARAALKRQET